MKNDYLDVLVGMCIFNVFRADYVIGFWVHKEYLPIKQFVSNSVEVYVSELLPRFSIECVKARPEDTVYIPLV
jgi:hypothetical protein